MVSFIQLVANLRLSLPLSVCLSQEEDLLHKTSLVYKGQVERTHHNHKGGGGIIITFQISPKYAGYWHCVHSQFPAYEVEYQTYTNGALSSLHDHIVPCAVCYVSFTATVLMIPGRLTCPTGWTQEHSGYLLMEACIYNTDKNEESIPGIHANTDEGSFYHTETNCNIRLPCPPYDPQKQFTCVVCTK